MSFHPLARRKRSLFMPSSCTRTQTYHGSRGNDPYECLANVANEGVRYVGHRLHRGNFWLFLGCYRLYGWMRQAWYESWQVDD